MIYKRYFIRQILKSAAAVFVIAVIIFASDCAINYLAEAIAGLLPPPMVGFLILLRVGIALEVILPVTFFLAVILALGRLYKDSEMTAFSACGIGMRHVLRLVLVLSLPVAIATAGASLYFRPHAWQKIYRVEDEAQNQFDISRLYPNTFLKIQSGKVVFFAEEVDDSENKAQKVFVHIADGESRHVIRAQQMIQAEPNANGLRVLFFHHGSMYELPSKGEPGKITRFDQAQYTLPSEHPSNPRYRRKATPTEQLVGSSRLQDITELQWRLSAPLSTILLGLLAVPLSKSNPRQGKFAKAGLAIIIFAVYFQLFVIARTWVDKAVVSPWPGIWWVPALLIGLTIILVWRTEDVFYRRLK